MKTVTDIIASLSGLNLSELKTIQVALDQEFIKFISIDEELYFLVFEILGEKPMSISRFSNSSLGTQWRKSQPAFDNLMSKLTDSAKLRKVVIKALKKFLLELLFEDIKNQGIPLNMKAICQFMGEVETTFEKSFPNYLSCGLGGLIVQQLGGGNVK